MEILTDISKNLMPLFYNAIDVCKPIMLLIVVLACIAVILFLVKALQFYREKEDVDELIIGLKNTLRHDRITEAVTLCNSTPGPVARILVESINAYQNKEDIRNALEDQAKKEVIRLEWGLNIMAIIAYGAPLLGLLGTVIFLLGAFSINAPTLDVLSRHVLRSLNCVAGGLTLSLLCHLGFIFLLFRVKSFCKDMETASILILTFYQGKQGTGEKEFPSFSLEPNLRFFTGFSGLVFYTAPFCSVIFILLVFFMLGTKWVIPIQGFSIAGKKLSLPTSTSVQTYSVSRSWIITVDADRNIYFNNKWVKDEIELEHAINKKYDQREREENENPTKEELVVCFDKSLPIEMLSKLKDIANRQKMNLSVMVAPSDKTVKSEFKDVE